MNIKQIFNLVILIVIIGLSTISYILIKDNVKKSDNIEYLRHNLIVKDSQISDLTFSTDELESYLKDKNSKHKIEVDSILKLRKIDIKNLKKYEHIKVQYIDTTSTQALPNGQIIKNDSIYKIPIKIPLKCSKIYGHILSKDSTSTMIITKMEGTNNIYITETYKKNFWD